MGRLPAGGGPGRVRPPLRRPHLHGAGGRRPRLGDPAAALAACTAGRALYPDDAELLFVEALTRHEGRDLTGAEACLARLLGGREPEHFGSVAAGLRGHKARRLLGAVLRDLGRPAEAEAEWEAALAERPDFAAARVDLAELYAGQGRWDEVEAAALRLEADAQAPVEAAVLRAKALLARRGFAAARALLEGAVAGAPQALWPRVLLTHALLQEGRDWDAAGRALRDVLALDPGHAEARRNLGVLLRQQGQALSPDEEQLEQLTARYRLACAVPSDIHEHLPTLYALARECRHVTELGTRGGVSTTALLYARPDRLVCYDRARLPAVDALASLAGRTEFVFHEVDVLAVEIEETDLLFVDTWHVYGQLKEELRLHAGKARKYVVLHDTTTFGDRGESAGHRGLWPAVEEFLAEGAFVLRDRAHNNNGLTVLERRPAGGRRR